MTSHTEKTEVLGIPISLMGIGNVSHLLAKKLLDKSFITTFVNPYACYLDDQDTEEA